MCASALSERCCHGLALALGTPATGYTQVSRSACSITARRANSACSICFQHYCSTACSRTSVHRMQCVRAHNVGSTRIVRSWYVRQSWQSARGKWIAVGCCEDGYWRQELQIRTWRCRAPLPAHKLNFISHDSFLRTLHAAQSQRWQSTTHTLSLSIAA